MSCWGRGLQKSGLVRYSSIGEFSAKDIRDLLAQERCMVNRSLPDKRPINAEVLVNQNVPQPHNEESLGGDGLRRHRFSHFNVTKHAI
jgi:hypothetical protein